MLPEIFHASQRVLQTSSGQSQAGEAEVFRASDSRAAQEQIRARLPAREAAHMVKAKARATLYTGHRVDDGTLTPVVPAISISKPLAALPLGAHWGGKRSLSDMSLHQALIFPFQPLKRILL